MGDHLTSVSTVDVNNRRFSHDELQWVLERAASLSSVDAERPYSASDAIALAAELGISEFEVRRALRDLDHRVASAPRRPGMASSERIVDLPARVAQADLTASLRARHLEPCELHGGACWTQRRDWWPDLERLGSELHVTAEVWPVGIGRSRTGLSVDLRQAAVGYGAWAGGGSAMTWLLLGPAAILGAAVTWVAMGAAAYAAYRRRLDAITTRLSDLLHELG